MPAPPQAVADHRRHRRRHPGQPFRCRRGGRLVASFFSEATLSWILAASFIAVALWTLVPDKLDDEESGLKKYGPFLTTLIAFFLAEMGDKTQVATVMLAAQYPHFWLVVIGTTLGMLIANVPVVLLSLIHI